MENGFEPTTIRLESEHADNYTLANVKQKLTLTGGKASKVTKTLKLNTAYDHVFVPFLVLLFSQSLTKIEGIFNTASFIKMYREQ